VILGAALLWFGWFGFNAGSAVSSGSLATSAFVVTNTAAATAALAWMFMSWVFQGQPSALGAASEAGVGLVAITPASGFVTPLASIIIGAGAGVICFLAVRFRSKVNVDDSLDVWACHGIGGTWGALATGLFATVAVNSAGANGLFYGNPHQFLTQLLAVAVVWAYSFIATWIILKILYAIMGLRLKAGEEMAGLDLSQHGEEAYRL